LSPAAWATDWHWLRAESVLVEPAIALLMSFAQVRPKSVNDGIPTNWMPLYGRY
jgi:hypothetical protein